MLLQYFFVCFRGSFLFSIIQLRIILFVCYALPMSLRFFYLNVGWISSRIFYALVLPARDPRIVYFIKNIVKVSRGRSGQVLGCLNSALWYPRRYTSAFAFSSHLFPNFGIVQLGNYWIIVPYASPSPPINTYCGY